MLASLGAGPFIDRWGALHLFPIILVPACLGLVAVAMSDKCWIPFVYLTLAGVSQGIASPMMTAVWAEVYGVEVLGTTKSTVSAFGIFATALGPLVLGWLLAYGLEFRLIIPVVTALGLLVTGVSLYARRVVMRQQEIQ